MKTSIKLLSLILVVCMFCAALIGCTAAEPAADAAPAAAPAEPAKQDTPAATVPEGVQGLTEQDNSEVKTSARDSVVIGLVQEPGTLDPTQQSDGSGYGVCSNIFEGLVWISNTLEVEPLLAESWDISPDGTVYTFHLRQGVKFHNSEPLTADDCVFTFDRAKEGGRAGSVMDLIEGYRAVDANTFEVTLKYAFAPSLELFGSNWIRIVNKKACEACGDSFAYNPVDAGTGPYKFVNWSSGSNITLVANDNYWRDTARIQNVEFRILPDTTTLSLAIETGDIDYGNIQVADIEYFDAHDEVSYTVATALIENYVGFNCQDEHFSDPRVRKAVSLVIDRMDALIVGNDSELGGSLCATDVPADGFGCNTDLPIVETDVELAKQLMAEAGYPDGFTTQIYVANVASRKNMATYIQEQIRQIGIEAELVIKEQSAVLDDMRAGNAPIFLMGYTATSGDADFFLYPQYHSNQSFNYFNYFNDDLDAKLEAARKSADPEERAKLYHEIQEELYENVPSMPMYHIYWKYGYNSQLSCTVAPMQRIYVYEWTWLA